MFRIAGVATSFFASLLLIGGAINGQETRPTKELISAIDRFIKRPVAAMTMDLPFS